MLVKPSPSCHEEKRLTLRLSAMRQSVIRLQIIQCMYISNILRVCVTRIGEKEIYHIIKIALHVVSTF